MNKAALSKTEREEKLKKLIVSSIVFICAVIIAGCSPKIVSIQTVDIQSLDVKTPLHISEDRALHPFEIQAGFAIGNKYNLQTQVDAHTMVNSKGIYEIEPVAGEKYMIEKGGANGYEYTGNNFNWRMPQAQAMLNLDLALNKNVALFLGTTFSGINNKVYSGFNGGIGFITEGKTGSLRFDFGVNHYASLIDATVVKFDDEPFSANSTRKVMISHISGDREYTNAFFSICFNSKNKGWLVNYFLQYAYGGHTFYDIEDEVLKFGETLSYYEEKDNVSYSAPFYQLSCGLFRNIDENLRLVAGVRATKHNDKKNNFFMFDSFLQFDLIVF